MSQFSHKFEFSHDETEGISIPKTLAPNFPTHFPIIPIAIILRHIGAGSSILESDNVLR